LAELEKKPNLAGYDDPQIEARILRLAKKRLAEKREKPQS